MLFVIKFIIPTVRRVKPKAVCIIIVNYNTNSENLAAVPIVVWDILSNTTWSSGIRLEVSGSRITDGKNNDLRGSWESNMALKDPIHFCGRRPPTQNTNLGALTKIWHLGASQDKRQVLMLVSCIVTYLYDNNPGNTPINRF